MRARKSDTRVRSALGVEFLTRRLARCELGWDRGMAHPDYPEYPDEPTEERPLTVLQERALSWVQAWRIRFHEYEEALYADPATRRGMLEGLMIHEEPTYYVRGNG